MFKKSEKLKLIRKSLEDAQCLGVAIRNAGMKSYTTIDRWRKERPLIDRYLTACSAKSENRRVDAVIDSLFKTALSGNVAAICFYLKNKAGWKDDNAYVQVNHYTQVWNGVEKKAQDVATNGRVHIGDKKEVPA